MILISSFQHGEFSTTFNGEILGRRREGIQNKLSGGSICTRDRITPMADHCNQSLKGGFHISFQIGALLYFIPIEMIPQNFIFEKRLYLSFFTLRRNECSRKVLCPFI